MLAKDTEVKLADRSNDRPARHFNPIALRGGGSASALIISGRRGDPGLDIRLVEAKLKLGKLYPEDMPQLAWDALESEYYGPNLCILALLYKPTSADIDTLLPGLKSELGLKEVDIKTASLRLAQYLVCKILDGKLDPIPKLEQFACLWRDGEYPIELSGLGQLEDEISYSQAMPRPGFLDEVFRELRELAELKVE